MAPTLYRSGAETKGNFGVRTLWKWLPDAVDARVRFFAWASLISQILIIGTGGAVRLTGSGLGCPTWPRCTEESYVTTPEMGFHGIIEFGNIFVTFLFESFFTSNLFRMILVNYYQHIGGYSNYFT